MVFDYQKEFDEPQVSDGPKVISKESVDFIVIQGILMITKSSMIQREFQLEVCRGVRFGVQLSCTETQFQKCSQSGKNGFKHPMLFLFFLHEITFSAIHKDNIGCLEPFLPL